ncbi:MAG: beta-propeller domain-containing protein [Candidatus Methanomethylicia archaeon]
MDVEVRRKSVVYGFLAVLFAIFVSGFCFRFGIQPIYRLYPPDIGRFSSYGELERFLKSNLSFSSNFSDKYLIEFSRGSEISVLSEGKVVPAHSTTNIQVAGVDEADIVKTDGEYLYIVSDGNVYIVRGYPPNRIEIVSKLSFNKTYNLQIYVSGDRLVVLGCGKPQLNVYKSLVIPIPNRIETIIFIYDISNRVNPILKRSIVFNGTILSSRMINDHVYVVLNNPALEFVDGGFKILIPKISINGFVRMVEANRIWYVNVSDVFYYFTMVGSINVFNDFEDPSYEVFLIGATSCIYVSHGNLYLTIPNTRLWVKSSSLSNNHETFIYRVELKGDEISLKAKGIVQGYILNQFSMDEYNGFLRVATTTWEDSTSKNNVFILDMNLNVVGKLLNLAVGERIYSARFMGDRCYLVTFRQVDPFFVIDLSDPMNPKVLGFLKIPGFSSYLHPYDENHIIGVGLEDGRVKLSLFDVSNVDKPVELSKYVVEGEYSSTLVLQDHKAFLFDKSMKLLAIPISILNVTGGGYIKSYWQGLYVFQLDLEVGFILRGRITHQNNVYDWSGKYFIRRALYIGEFLYTVSDGKIVVNSIGDLKMVGELPLT